MCIRDRYTAVEDIILSGGNIEIISDNIALKAVKGNVDFTGADTGIKAVSYTHLDVYKRQLLSCRPVLKRYSLCHMGDYRRPHMYQRAGVAHYHGYADGIWGHWRIR